MKINHPVTDREMLMKEDTILVTKTDTKGRITFANDDFVEISGFSRDELIGANHNLVRHPDMPPEAFADLWATIKQGKPWRNLVKNRTKTGDYYWVEAHVSPIYEKGHVKGFVSCRYAPSREQIRTAEMLYEKIRNKKATLRNTSVFDKINPVRKLGFSGKMACLAALLLLPAFIALAILNAEKNTAIEFAEKEIKGIEYLNSLKPLLLQLTERRSRLDSWLLSGSGDTASMMQINKQVNDTIKAIDTGVETKYGADFKTAESWQAIKSDWDVLEKQGLQVSAAESFAQHGHVIEQIKDFIVHISDQSNLMLDPDIDSFYLMSVVSIRLPELLDYVSELRSVASRAAKNTGTPDQAAIIEIVRLDQHIDKRLSQTQRDFTTAFGKNADIKAAIAPKLGEFTDSLKLFTGSIKQDVLLKQSITLSTEKIASLGNAATNSLGDLHETTLPQLKSIIEKRIEGLQQDRLMQLSFIAIIMLGVGLAGYWVIGGMAKTLKQLTATFLKITDGHFRNMVDLDRPDEIGDLWRALESMQVALNVDISNTRDLATKAIRTERALENVSSSVMVANNNLEIIFMNKSVKTLFENAEADIRKKLPDFNASKLMGANIDQFHKNPLHQRSLLAKLDSTFRSSLEIGGRHMNIVANPVMDADGRRIGIVVEWLDRTREVKIEQEIETIVECVKAGQLDQRLSLADKQGFFAKLSEGINQLADVIEGVLGDIGNTMGGMAEGDLTRRITRDYQGIYLDCKNDINATIDKLNEIFGQVIGSASYINNSSQEIASGNNNLSQRAEQQAANLEQTAASMEELTSTVKNNADNAQQANAVASGARELAEKGGKVVHAAVTAMQDINDSSNKIADIIGVIDEIAFQTNLLALNASVEAARAGEQGRGFSVVATEVRNLAQRSATAARESKELIQSSVQKVRSGTEYVNQTGAALNEIVGSVKKVGDIVAAIANASAEQSAGIAQVNQAVAQMDEITQQNAALAEEASAASVSMSDLSANMVELLAFFKLDEKGDAPRSVAPVASGRAPASAATRRGNAPPAPRYQAAASSNDEWEDF